MPARVPKQPLSLERVLSAAVALADAHGASAVTMRRLAEELDCEAMSLYHHVADKGALLAGMVNEVVMEIVAAAAAIPDEADWRAAVGGRCLAARRVMLTHPWAPAIVQDATNTPPALFVLYEQFVGSLVAAGFSYDLAHRAIHAMGSFVLGFSNELFDPAPGEEEASAEEMMAMAEAMPHLTELAGIATHEAQDSLSMCDTQAEFEFTLGLLLDGLEARRAGA